MDGNIPLFNNEFIIATLNLEQRILNFKNLKHESENTIGVCQRYFRSSLTRRLIGNEILANTIEGKWSTQARIRKNFGLSKGQVSSIFNDCVQAEWFVVQDKMKRKSKQPHYQAAKILIKSVEIYQRYIWQDFETETLKTFLEHFVSNSKLATSVVHKEIFTPTKL